MSQILGCGIYGVVGEDVTAVSVALRSAQAEPEAFEVFYRAHAEALLVFLARGTLEPQTSLELCAEAFAIAFAKRSQFRGRTDAEAAAWLYEIARSLLAQHYRRGRVQQRALRRLGIAVPAFSEDDFERVEQLASLDELRRSVRHRFNDLPGKQRDAIALRVVEELPYTEVADRLGVSEQTARARVSRGLGALRAVLAAPQPEETS